MRLFLFILSSVLFLQLYTIDFHQKHEVRSVCFSKRAAQADGSRFCLMLADYNRHD